MDDFRNHVWEDTSFDIDEADRRPQDIDSFSSSDDTLRNAAGITTSGVLSSIKIGSSSIKIGSRVWTLGESISSIGTTAVCKSKLRDSFGDAWAEASVTGIVLGKGAKKKIRVRWTNLKDAEDMEYGYNHKIFANPLSPLCMKGRKSVVVSPTAPQAAGAGATVSKSVDDMLLAMSSTSRDQSASEARLEEPSLHDQSDILSASRSAEVSGMQRKRGHDEVEKDENPKKQRPKCSHGKQKRFCKECGGSGICSHGKQKAKCNKCHGKHKRICKECGGSGICSHGKQKQNCKECGGSSICSHGKRKAQCKECGGSGICSHGKQKQKCKECGGSGFCSHGKRKAHCKECGGSGICRHGKQKRFCQECGGSAICIHGKIKRNCKECGGSGICGHGKRRARCKECRPPASTPAAAEGSEVPAQAAAGEAGAGSEAAGTVSAE